MNKLCVVVLLGLLVCAAVAKPVQVDDAAVDFDDSAVDSELDASVDVDELMGDEADTPTLDGEMDEDEDLEESDLPEQLDELEEGRHTAENAQLTKILNDLERKLQNEINSAARTRDSLKKTMDKEIREADKAKGKYKEASRSYSSTVAQANNEIKLIDKMRALMGQLSGYKSYAKCRDIRSRKNFSGVTTSRQFTYSFWLKPRQGPTGSWRNILHRGNNDRTRMPAMWLYPREWKIHIRVGTRASWNTGCDCSGIKGNRWQHVALVVDGSYLNSFLNGRRCCRTRHNGVLAPSGLLRVSDPWYHPVNGGIADLRVYPYAVDAGHITKLSKSVPHCNQ